MSSIRLSGTSSGYYDLTVPAVAGTNSIDLSNLPVKDSSGNLAITGQLGINTTGTGVSGQFGTGITVRRAVPEVHLQRDDGAGNGGVLMDNASSTRRMYVGTYDANSETHIGTNGTQRVIVNASGHVTKPNQPAFKQGVDNRSATGSDRVISGNNGDTFTYQTRDNHNVGSHWSSTTGRFTCPVAGTYMFYCSLMRYGTNGTVLENRIKKNGSLMFARAYADGYTAAYEQSMLVTTTVCAVNDYIEFFVQGTTSIYQDDTYLGGYLLG